MSSDATPVSDAVVSDVVSSGMQVTPPAIVTASAEQLPSGWKFTALGQLAAFRTGPFGSALHKSDYIDDGIPLINPMHIVDEALLPESRTSVSERAANRLADFRLQRDDIVIGRRGDMGRCAVVRESQAGWLCGTGSLIIRCVGGVDVAFLQRVLTTERIVALIKGSSVGSTMVNLNQSALARLPIQCPPLPEQRAIAGALSDVDGLLGALEALIAKKRAIKQAAMQQLLTGKTRLPGFSSPIIATALGALPADWVIAPLGQICVKIQDGTHFSPKLGGGDRLYVTSRNIGFGILDLSDADTISESEHRKIYARCDTQFGDLLLTKDGANTGNAAINTLDEECSLLSSVAFTRFDSRLDDAQFFLQYILSGPGQRRLKEMMSGNAITRLTLEKIRGYSVPRPSREEQQAIAAVLSDMDVEIAALETRRDKTRAIKQGMMQQLLTGRVRLVSPEAAA